MSEQRDVVIVLSKQTIKYLSEIAESQCRTISGQAVWYIVTGIEETHRANREILKEKGMSEAEDRIDWDEVLGDSAHQRFYKSWMEKHGDRMEQSFEERHRGAFIHALDVEVEGLKEDLRASVKKEVEGTK